MTQTAVAPEDGLATTEDERPWIRLNPPVRFASQMAMRFGPRTYTPEQAAMIETVMGALRGSP